MHARFLAALMALLLLWTGAWTHEVPALPADAGPALSVAVSGTADTTGSIDDHHLDDQGGLTLDPPDGASQPVPRPRVFVAHGHPAVAAEAPPRSPHLPGPQRPPSPALA